MVNKVILVGNLGRDPEMRSTASGQSVANFSVATSRKWNDRDGNRQEQTEWHNIVCFGRQAEIAQQYLTKGRQVFIEGRLHTSSWDDRQSGEKRYRTEVICDNFQMLGRRGDGGGGAVVAEHARRQRAKGAAPHKHGLALRRRRGGKAVGGGGRRWRRAARCRSACPMPGWPRAAPCTRPIWRFGAG